MFDDAHFQLQQGYYEKAIQEAGDSYRQTKKDILWNWRFRILLAEALMRNNQSNQSVELLTEDPPSSLPLEIRARKKIIFGQALCRIDRDHDGEKVLAEAKNMIPGGSRSLQAELAFAHGNCSLASPLLATQYFEKAADLADKADPFIAASSLGNIGHLLDTQGRYDEAAEWFQKALPLVEASKSRLLKEKTLGNLGSVYSDLGDFKRSIESSEQAQSIADQIGRLDDKETWLVTLGRSYASLPGDYPDGAERSYGQALSIAHTLHDDAISRKCLHDLASLALDEHDLKKAKNYWQQEVAATPHGGAAEIDAWLDEGRIAMAENDLANAQALFQRIDQDPRTSASRHAFVQEQIGKIYWMERKPADAERMFRQGIQTVEAELAKIREQYWVSFLDEHAHRFDSYIRFLISQNKPVRALEQAEHLRELAQAGPLKSAQTRLNITALQNQLQGRKQVILDYHVTDEESFLWLITARDIQVFNLPPHRELYQLIDRHNNAIQDQRGIEDMTVGQELYRALIQPAEKFIPKEATVSIIPSKILCLLNFETLVVPQAKPHYWIEDVVVQNASSLARTFGSPASRIHSRKELLLIGAPEEVNPAFPSLRHAAEEIAKVEDHFTASQRQVISGAAATPQAYKSSNPQQYRYIHFVTHGIPNEKAPMESAIVLSGTSSSYKLYARDILTTPLSAELVTISACYGAGKRWYVSEGMVGLAWAFMHAGAHQVIAALWEVDDASTPELMNHFYQGIDQHLTDAEALHAAKLAMLHSNGPRNLPYFWGSLQLYVR